jgi:hypothetical protein
VQDPNRKDRVPIQSIYELIRHKRAACVRFLLAHARVQSSEWRVASSYRVTMAELGRSEDLPHPCFTAQRSRAITHTHAAPETVCRVPHPFF